jgi:hypothetical protein
MLFVILYWLFDVFLILYWPGQLDTNIGFQQKLWNKTNKGEASLASLYNEVTGE